MARSRTKKQKTQESQPQTTSEQKPRSRFRNAIIISAIAFLIITTGVVIVSSHIRTRTEPPASPNTPARPLLGPETPLKDFRVVNAHEHLYKRSHLDKYLEAAQHTGIVQTLFVASSEFTFKGKSGRRDVDNDWNSTEIINAAREFPELLMPFITIYPGDPDKLDKIKQYVAEGAKGLKLYTGHSNFYEDRPLDAPEMLPVYAYCEETALPICWHVNLVRYGAEFERVMKQFPNMLVIVPHFGVTFFRPRDQHFLFLQKLLDTYPNLYTDTSFGTREILVQGLYAVQKDPDIFRAFIKKYQDRILFGTDMVVTGNKEKTVEWIESVIRACREVLEKDVYQFPLAANDSPYALKGVDNPNGELRGLGLPDDILKKIYETNFLRLFPQSLQK